VSVTSRWREKKEINIILDAMMHLEHEKENFTPVSNSLLERLLV